MNTCSIAIFVKKTEKEPVIYLVDTNHRPLEVIYSTYEKLESLIHALILYHQVKVVEYFENVINFSLSRT
jgi:hypothetical protein